MNNDKDLETWATSYLIKLNEFEWMIWNELSDDIIFTALLLSLMEPKNIKIFDFLLQKYSLIYLNYYCLTPFILYRGRPY